MEIILGIKSIENNAGIIGYIYFNHAIVINLLI